MGTAFAPAGLRGRPRLCLTAFHNALSLRESGFSRFEDIPASSLPTNLAFSADVISKNDLELRLGVIALRPLTAACLEPDHDFFLDQSRMSQMRSAGKPFLVLYSLLVIPLIKEKSHDIVELCRRFHVRRLELFGSAASKEFDPRRSDLDFLVVFDAGTPGQSAHRYFGLLAGLEDLFQRHVDLVELEAIRNPYFSQGIQSSRTLLYAA